MMSAFFYFQTAINSLFNNCIKLYWCYISSSWNMKAGAQFDVSPPPCHLPQKKVLSKCLALLALNAQAEMAGNEK